MSALANSPLRCGISPRGVGPCRAPATRVLRVNASCGCAGVLFCCDTHPLSTQREGRCVHHGLVTTQNGDFRAVNEGDLPDRPDIKITARHDDGRVVEVPA